MSRRQGIVWSAVAWLGVGLFWLVATRNFHPTESLALITTGSLVMAYATAVYANHLLLIPACWRVGHYGAYAGGLLAVMALLTAAALAVIRVSYFRIWGPDADPYGAYKHYAIDFLGMGVHVLAAAGLVWLINRIVRARPAAGCETE